MRFLFRVTLRRLDLLPEMYHVKEPQKVPLILNQDEARRLLAMSDKVRNRLLLSLGYGAGLRAGEVVRLKVKHIDRAQKIIRIEQSKGQKDRLVMLSPEMLALLEDWWPLRTTKYDVGVPMAERWLFPGRRKGLHLSPRQLNRLFHEAAATAGITKAVNLHALRHSFATHLYDRGVDIRMIQALLGHTKLETTARYARVATGLITSIESPLDRLNAPRKRSKKRSKRHPPAA
jgi:site-specific recombinase XerD